MHTKLEVHRNLLPPSAPPPLTAVFHTLLPNLARLTCSPAWSITLLFSADRSAKLRTSRPEHQCVPAGSGQKTSTYLKKSANKTRGGWAHRQTRRNRAFVDEWSKTRIWAPCTASTAMPSQRQYRKQNSARNKGVPSPSHTVHNPVPAPLHHPP